MRGREYDVVGRYCIFHYEFICGFVMLYLIGAVARKSLMPIASCAVKVERYTEIMSSSFKKETGNLWIQD